MAKKLRQIEVSVTKAVTVTYETKITVTAADHQEAVRTAIDQSKHVPERKWDVIDTTAAEVRGDVL